MLEVIQCESGFRHFDKSGNVLIGITGDVGIMQIAPQYWDKEAKELGYNIYTVAGNLAMGKIIMEKQGRNAWVCYKNRFITTNTLNHDKL
jgi:hypothetical protein